MSAITLKSTESTSRSRAQVAILAIACICVVAFLSWGLNKGLDVTDESYNLSYYLHADKYQSSTHGHHILVNRLTGPFQPTLINFRILRLVLEIAAAVLFALGFYAWLKSNFDAEITAAGGFPLILSFSILAKLTGYSLGEAIIDYNSIVSFCVVTNGAIALFILSKPPGEASRSNGCRLAVLAAGALVPVAFLAKFPTALILLFVNLAWIAGYFFRGPWREVFTLLGSYVLGVLLAIAGMVLFVSEISDWFPSFLTEVRAITVEAYSPGEILLRYLWNVHDMARFVVKHFGLAFACVIAAGIFHRVGKGSTSFDSWVYAACIGAICLIVAFAMYKFRLYETPYFNGYKTASIYIALLVGFACGLVIVYWGDIRVFCRFDGLTIGMAWLVSLPFLGAMGTINNLWLNSLFDIVGWFGLYVVMSLLIVRKVEIRWLVLVAVLAPTLFGLTQILQGRLWNPYALTGPLLEQTVRLDEPPSIRGIEVDRAAAEYFSDIRGMLEKAGFESGDPIVALYNLPGVVLAVGGVSPGVPSFFLQQKERNRRALQRGGYAPDSLFLLLSRPLSSEMVGDLRAAGIDFPDGYVEVGSVHNPYSDGIFDWWRDDDEIRVYAPRGR